MKPFQESWQMISLWLEIGIVFIVQNPSHYYSPGPQVVRHQDIPPRVAFLPLVGRPGAQGQTHSPTHIAIVVAFRVAALAVLLLLVVVAIVVVRPVHHNRHRVLVNLRVGQALAPPALQFRLPRRAPLPLRVLIAQIIIRISLLVVVIEDGRALRRLLC